MPDLELLDNWKIFHKLPSKIEIIFYFPDRVYCLG